MKILWLSRHEPQKTQVDELKEVFGNVEIIQENKTIEDVKEIKRLMQEYNADEVVAVLPINLLGSLTELGIYPLRAVMEREVNEGSVEFKHKYFERIKGIKVDYERLK